MAISFGSIGNEVIDDASTPDADNHPQTWDIPAHNNGDLLGFVLCTTSANTPAVGVITPSGWVAGPSIEGGAQSAVRLSLFLKKGDGVESSVTISMTGSQPYGGGSMCLVLPGGADAADAIDVSGTQVQDSGTDITSPDVTATEADVLVLYAYCFDDDLATAADHDSDAGFSGTSRGYQETGTGEANANGFSMAVSTKVQGSGATGSCVWSTNGDSDAGCAFTIVLKSGSADTVINATSESIVLTTYPASVTQAPRVWLNTTETKVGATEMTVESYSLDGTSITFTDPAGAPTGSLKLGVERTSDGLLGWIDVTVNAGGTLFFQTNTGAVTPSGAIVRDVLKDLTGVLTPSGLVVKGTTKSFAGSLPFAGALVKETLKVFTGSMTPSGALATLRIAFQMITGSLTPAGTLVKKTAISFTGLLASSGTLTRVTAYARTVVGSLAPIGALVKEARKFFTGSLTPSGVLTTIKSFVRTIVGALTPAGTLAKKTLKNTDGALAPSGTITTLSQFFRTITGVFTPAGVLVRKTFKSFVGSLTPTSVLTTIKAFFRTISGSLTPAGTLTKKTTKPLAGSLTPVGSLIKRTLKTFAGSLTPSAILARAVVFTRAIVGSLTPSGTLVKETQKAIAGTLTPSGAITKKTLKLLLGSLTPSGGLSTAVLFTAIISGVLNLVGDLATTFIPGVGAGGRIYRRLLNLINHTRDRKSDDDP